MSRYLTASALQRLSGARVCWGANAGTVCLGVPHVQQNRCKGGTRDGKVQFQIQDSSRLRNDGTGARSNSFRSDERRSYTRNVPRSDGRRPGHCEITFKLGCDIVQDQRKFGNRSSQCHRWIQSHGTGVGEK